MWIDAVRERRDVDGCCEGKERCGWLVEWKGEWGTDDGRTMRVAEGG